MLKYSSCSPIFASQLYCTYCICKLQIFSGVFEKEMGQLRKDNQFLLEEVKQLQNKVQEKSGRKKKHVNVKRSTRVSQFINIYLLIITI